MGASVACWVHTQRQHTPTPRCTRVPQVLRNVLGAVTALPADDRLPDCCFIEDTAVVVGSTAVVANIGAGPRQGEEAPVAAALQVRAALARAAHNLHSTSDEHAAASDKQTTAPQPRTQELGYQIRRLQPPATLDGGDVLQLPGGNIILVGLSRRTNAEAVAQLAALLPQQRVLGVPVAHGLHLKSACTALDGATLLCADDAAGRSVRRELEKLGDVLPANAQHVLVEPAAANVLVLGAEDVVVASGLAPATHELLQRLTGERGMRMHACAFGEFAKADGSLTCCSIILPPML
jgi:dimethylargininase